MAAETVTVNPDADLDREARAREVIQQYAWGNAAVGLIPVPLLDLVAITGVQLKMVHSLCEIYQTPFKEHAVRGTILSTAAGLGSMTIAAGLFFSVLKFVPIMGMTAAVLALPSVAGAFTYAVGKMYMLHFESGGTILTLDPVAMRAHFETAYREGLAMGKDKAATLKTTGAKAKAEIARGEVAAAEAERQAAKQAAKEAAKEAVKEAKEAARRDVEAVKESTKKDVEAVKEAAKKDVEAVK